MGKVATCHRQVAGFDSPRCALLTHGGAAVSVAVAVEDALKK